MFEEAFAERLARHANLATPLEGASELDFNERYILTRRSRRIRLFWLDPPTLWGVLRGLQGQEILLVSGLPGDAVILDATYDQLRRCFVLFVGSMTYEQVPEGTIPPDGQLEVEPVARPVIGWFASLMEAKLAKHDHDRPGWDGMEKEDILRLLSHHYDKLVGATMFENPKYTISAAVDVANYCLMMADVLASKMEEERRDADQERGTLR